MNSHCAATFQEAPASLNNNQSYSSLMTIGSQQQQRPTSPSSLSSSLSTKSQNKSITSSPSSSYNKNKDKDSTIMMNHHHHKKTNNKNCHKNEIATKAAETTAMITGDEAELDGTIRVQSGSGFRIVTPFPWRLHKMLEDMEKKGLEWIVSWLPDGKSFQVHCPAKFVELVSPDYFRHKRFKSFQRQLYLYGFKSVEDTVKRGAYTHPCFVRENRKLCQLITRHKKSNDVPMDATAVAAAVATASQQPQGRTSQMGKMLDAKNHVSNPNIINTSNLTMLMKPIPMGQQQHQYQTQQDESVGRLAPISATPSTILGRSMLPADAWTRSNTAAASTVSYDSTSTTTTSRSNSTTNQDDTNFSSQEMNYWDRCAEAAQAADSHSAFNPAMIGSSHVAVVADDISPQATFSYNFLTINGGNNNSSNSNERFTSSSSTSSGSDNYSKRKEEAQKVRETFQWLVNDVHVSMRDLKHVLSITPSTSSSTLTSFDTNGPQSSSSSSSRRNKSSKIQEYREDIISLFGGR